MSCFSSDTAAESRGRTRREAGAGLPRPAGRQTFATVDLDAIRHNVRALHGALSVGTSITAIVKADAYGHGAVETAAAALEGGAAMLGVAMAEEAVPLREAGITAPVLVIGPSNEAQMALGTELDLDMCVFTVPQLHALERAAQLAGRPARAHIKADTGMSRIGVRNVRELMALLDVLPACPNLSFTGLFTHYASADSYGDQETTLRQHARFLEMAAAAHSLGYHPLLHASNSAAAQDVPASDLDMVRFGISLYGYPAGEGRAARHLDLRPAMQVFAELSFVKDLGPGDRISYGGTFAADRSMRIATVQIGYGDGYNRLLSNRGHMIVQTDDGPRCAPVVGRVCMDMTMIDVTGLRGVRPGDLAVVMGRLGDLRVDADDLAGLLGTISYEVLLDYSSRVPRLYTGRQN